MDPKGGGIIHNPAKPLEYSSITHEESEHLSFQVSQLEDLIKGFVRTIDLFNLEERMEKRMGHVYNKMEHMDTKMDERMEHMDAKIDERMRHMDTKVEERMGQMENNMVERIVNLIKNS